MVAKTLIAFIFLGLELLLFVQGQKWHNLYREGDVTECVQAEAGSIYNRQMFSSDMLECLDSTKEILPSASTKCECATAAEAKELNAFRLAEGVCFGYAAELHADPTGTIEVYMAALRFHDTLLPKPEVNFSTSIRSTHSVSGQSMTFADYSPCSDVDYYQLTYVDYQSNKVTKRVAAVETTVELIGPDTCKYIGIVIFAYNAAGEQLGENGVWMAWSFKLGEASVGAIPWGANACIFVFYENDMTPSYFTFEAATDACAAIDAELYGSRGRDNLPNLWNVIGQSAWVDLTLGEDDSTWSWADSSVELSDSTNFFLGPGGLGDTSKRCAYYNYPLSTTNMTTKLTPISCEEEKGAICFKYYD